jgi:hypothetical protein
MPKGRSGHRRSSCTVCRHAERTRIDYLIASGGTGTLKPLGPRFGLSSQAIYNHAKKHVSAEFRAAVRIGPFESEEKLRQLCAENGASIVETLRAVNAAVMSRWLTAFEVGGDEVFVSLTGQIRKNLELLARLTKELMPPSMTVVNTNNFMLFEHPEYVQVIAALGMALRDYPDARRAVTLALRQFSAAGERPLIEAPPTSSEAA